MHFNVLGGVSEVDLSSARLLVEVAERSVQLPDFVSSRDFWRDYLIKKTKSSFRHYCRRTPPPLARIRVCSLPAYEGAQRKAIRMTGLCNRSGHGLRFVVDPRRQYFARQRGGNQPA